MNKITMAKALKLKNRFAGRIARLQEEIITYNSVQDGQERPDVNEMLKFLDRLVENLSCLKFAIYNANMKVQRTIFDLAERKSRLTWLQMLNTRNGTFNEYGDTPTSYTATLRKTDVDKMTSALEQEVDRLQDTLDKFNHTTEIEVPSELLEAMPTFESKKRK